MRFKLLLLSLWFWSVSGISQTLDRKFVNTNGRVNAMAQKGDTAYIGGSFSEVGIGSGKMARFNIGSTKPDGNYAELDNSASIYASEPDGSGGVYLLGYFNNYNGSPIAYTNIIHVLNGGALDPSFGPVVIDYFSSTNEGLKKAGNALYVGGYFNTIQGASRPYLAALNATTGALLPWTPAEPNSAVTRIEVKDTLVFVSGDFYYLGNVYEPYNFGVISANSGKLVKNFPSPNSTVTGMKVEGNSLYAGGNFDKWGQYAQGLAKINNTTIKADFDYPYTDGTVYAILSDGSGGYFIGGSFNQVGNQSRNNVAHILSNGSVDPAFNVTVNGSVSALATDGSNLYLAGSFTAVNNTSRNYCASVLISNGSLTIFNPNANSNVYTVAVAGSNVYIGGSFTTVRGGTNLRNYAACITTSNTVTAWNPNPDNVVNKIILTPAQTTVFMAGNFSTIRSAPFPYLARVNTSNGAAFNWKPNPDSYIYEMALSGNKVYVGGYFSSINGIGRQYFAEIDTASNNPTALQADLDNVAEDIYVNGNKVYISGYFASIQDSIRNGIARINLTTGLVDNWRFSNLDYPVYAINGDANNTYIGGDFSFIGVADRKVVAEIDIPSKALTSFTVNPSLYANNVNTILKNGNNLFLGSNNYIYDGTNYYYYLLGLNSITGNISADFRNKRPDGAVNRMVVNNGKLLVSGSISSIVNNANAVIAKRKNMAAYDLGTFNLSSDAYDPNGEVNGLYNDPGGKLITIGDFNLMNALTRNNLAAIDMNTGSVLNWDPNPNAEVHALAVKDTTVFAGGSFTNIAATTTQVTRNYLAGISTQSGHATSWRADANNIVYCLAVKDTLLYAGGSFTVVKSAGRSYGAAISTSAATVTPWIPSANNYINTILPVDTTVYIGGYFTTVKGTVRNYLARCNTSNGNPLSWNPTPNSYVQSLALAGNTLYTGGSFSTIAGQQRVNLAAFDVTTNLLTSFDAAINDNTNYGYSVKALATYGKQLYIGDENLQSIGSQSRGNLAALDTVTKQATPFNPLPNASVSTLMVSKNKLLAGGDFSQLGNRLNPSYFAAFTLEPQTPASSLTFSNLQLTSVQANWTGGSGENRIVVVKQGAPPASPVDGGTYTANAAFGSGSQVGTGGRAVYKGSGSTVNVTNLKPNRTYYFAVYEYNGSGSGTDYLQSPVLVDSITTPCPVYTDKISPSDTIYICAGDSILLTAPAGFVHYSWSSGDTTTQINGAAGIYHVAVTDTNGCVYTTPDVHIIARTASPGISPAGPVHLCSYDTATLIITGGPFATIAWNTGDTSVSITVTDSGMYKALVTDSAGCQYETSIVQVSKSAPVIPVITPAGPLALCAGDSALLSVSGGNFTSVFWNSGQTTNFIYASQTGSYMVSATDSSGCHGMSAPVVVDVRAPLNPQITASGPVNICNGQTITLTVENGPYSDILWSTSETTTSITVSSAGSYTVTVKNDIGCQATSAPVVISVQPVPVIVLDPSTGLCRGSSLTLTCTAASAYLWSNGATTQSIITDTTGSFSVTATYPGGCSATSATKTITFRGCGAPLNRNARNITAYSATLKWRRIPCAAGYEVEYRQAGDTAFHVLTTGDTTLTLINLLASITYEWRLRTECGPIKSDYTPVLSFTTLSGINTVPNLGNDTTVTKCPGFTTDIRNVFITRFYPTVIWSTPTPGAVETGVYTLVAGNQFGNDTVQITVVNNPKPDLGADTAVYICAGTLRSIENVYNTAPYATVQYSITRPEIASEGVYSVIVTNANGCADTAIITVLTDSPYTPIITASGPLTFCKGDSVALTVSGAIFTAYNWSNGFTVNPAIIKKAGLYRVTVTNNHGCSKTTPFTVVVTQAPPTPVITTNPAVITGLCPGTTVTLTSSAANNVWSTSETTAAIQVTNTGVYNVKTFDTDGCSSGNFKSVGYRKCGPPSGPASTGITGAMATVYWKSVPCVSSYEVDYREAGTSVYTTVVVTDTFATLTTLTPTTKYEWRVRCVCATGAGDNTFVRVFTTGHFAKEIFAKNNEAAVTGKLAIEVFPNPARNTSTLKVSGHTGEFSLRITTAAGTLIWQSNRLNRSNILLPIEGLPSGVYFVSLNNGAEQKTVRLLIEK